MQNSRVLIIGRQAVLDAVATPSVRVIEVLIARSATGGGVDEVEDRVRQSGVEVRRVSDRKLDQLAGDDRRHQGFAAEIEPPLPLSIEAFVSDRTGRAWPTHVLVLDQVHNPANVGMILRTAAAAGIDGVVLPRHGTAAMGPLVVKAGSGVVYRVPHIDASTGVEAVNAFRNEGFEIVVLDAEGESVFDAAMPERAVWVLGNESVGVSSDVAEVADALRAVPLANGVESLNVAAAAAVVSFEVARRRSG